MATEDWTEYVSRITKGQSAEAVAERTGIHVTSIYRWLASPERKSAENAIKFARGMNRPPIEALIAAGYIAPAETEQAVVITQAAADMPSDELVAEIAKRISA